MDNSRRMVALLIHPIRKLQHIARAIAHTQLTPFAACLDDVHFALGDGEFVYVERGAPKLHRE
jgi:hypothetical protein